MSHKLFICSQIFLGDKIDLFHREKAELELILLLLLAMHQGLVFFILELKSTLGAKQKLFPQVTLYSCFC